MARSRSLSAAVWAGVGVLVLVAIIVQPSSPVTGAPATITTNLAGPQLFALACASCHGLSGKGRVFTADSQKIEVPAITYTALSKV
jgi:mono/diheme cytochrome c family protein